jgi:hypothetical protein
MGGKVAVRPGVKSIGQYCFPIGLTPLFYPSNRQTYQNIYHINIPIFILGFNAAINHFAKNDQIKQSPVGCFK